MDAVYSLYSVKRFSGSSIYRVCVPRKSMHRNVAGVPVAYNTLFESFIDARASLYARERAQHRSRE